ncbi:MAG: uroporphyrinogen-III synthase, partial [Candidatus Eremiobacteraeota bacterium]|nr:uroporphyrinogen-III synthase [Candidatus Eremiobacteraeota bacterium]
AFGRVPDIVPPRSDAQALADELLARAHAGARIAIFAAASARPLLQQRLRGAGFTVRVSAAYATRELSPRDIVQHIERAQVIVLTSGSGARALAAGLRRGPGVAALRGRFVACIGPVTAAEARRVGILVAAVAHEPSAAGLLAAVAAAQHMA